jgi:hypothetical protein
MAETKTVNLNVETNLGSLKSQLKTAQKEVETLSEKFGATSEAATNAARKAAELKDAIGDAKALTDAFNPDAKFNALTNSLSGVASGFSAYQGALGLIGVDSKELEATLLKVQSAMALSQGLQGLGEAKDSFIQLKAVIAQTAIGQKALNIVQAIGTTVMKALNFVMKQNPIFLIIGGVTALIAAIKIFNATSDDQAEKQKRINKLNEEYRKEIEKQLELDIKVRDSRKGGLDDQERAIKLLKAKGGTDKEVYEAERKLIDTQLEKLAYASGYRGFLLKDEIKKRKDLQNDKAILDAQYNKSEEEKTDNQKEENNKRAEKQREHNAKIREDKKKSDEELKAQILKAQKELDDEINRIAEEQLAKQKKAQEDRKEKAIKDEQDVYDNAKGFLEASIIDDENNIQAKKDLLEVEKEILLQNTELTQGEIASIESKYRKDREQLDKDELAKKRVLEGQKIDAVQSTLSTIGNLAELFAGKSRKQQEQAFKIQKAVNIANATIDTYKAATGAYSSLSAIPVVGPALGIAAAGLALSAGLLNVKKIASTKFDAGGGGGTPPSGGGGGGGTNAMQGNVITPNFNIVGNNGTNQLQQLKQAPIQAYVVSGEMSTQQSLDRNRLRNATL